ncbi:LptF/LptG family permease [Synechocystis sp. LKSZ1]|uniref:LptF/LptG family permease n=1 Tax=Synechocystis sp. LKSZ1 TaxID=3144951 RepID=UPI00336BD784
MLLPKFLPSWYTTLVFRPYGSIMDRYLATQLIPPFIFSVGLVATLGVAVGNLSDLANKIVEKQLPVLKALEILILKVPEFVAYALPISVMLTTLMTFGRLSSDSEIIALRSCGVSLYRIVLPAIILSLGVTVGTFMMNEWVVPAANYQATSILVNAIQEEHPFWQTRDIFYPEFETLTLANGQTSRRLKNLVYAERFDGKTMQALTVLSWAGTNLKQILISHQATWNEQQQKWEFFEGTLYKLSPDSSYQEALPFQHQTLDLPKAAFDFARQSRDPYEMNIIQARQYMDILRLIGDTKKLNFFQVRTEQKIAFPFVCMVFALVGSALGTQPQKVSRAKSFGLSIAVIFIYYLLSFLLGSLGMIEWVSPVVAAWGPNLIGLGFGLWLIYQFNHHV